MTLPVPGYIAAANVAEPAPRYEWDDWNLPQIFDGDDDGFKRRLERLSYRAILGFTIATGEWIVQRFARLSSDPVPELHLEAMWAGMIDSRYVRYWEPPDSQWLGPIRGALRLAIVFSLEAMVDLDACGEVALSGDRAARVALRVLPDPRPFESWRDRIVARLEQLYPHEKRDPVGDVVPREALDPAVDFRPEQAEALVRRYLAGLDPARNQFLATPEEMRVRRFRGTPYQFDVAEDRMLRNDF